MTPPSATASSGGADQVGLARRPAPAAQVDQRPRGGQAADEEQRERGHGDQPERRQPPAAADDRDEQLAPGEVAHQRRRLGEDQRAGHEGEQQQQGARARSGRPSRRRGVSDVRAARARIAAASTSPTARLIAKMPRQSATASTTAPNSGPTHAAELLDGRDDPEGYAAALDGVEVGHQGERRRHQPATADALQEPARDHARHVVGQRGHQRPDGEQHQRRHQHRHPAAQVGDPADQRQHRDVAEQEAGHDRGGSLQLVDRDADRAHHLREREHHDVGVGRGEGDGDGGQPQQQPGPARRPDPRPPAPRAGSWRGDVGGGAVVGEADRRTSSARCRGRRPRSAGRCGARRRR